MQKQVLPLLLLPLWPLFFSAIYSAASLQSLSEAEYIEELEAEQDG